jgi:hypothetical protein
MDCPDEDTFARFVEGLMAPAEAGVIERHVDGCARCADLTAEFGRLFAERPSPAPRGRWGAPAVAGVLHLAWALVVWRGPGTPAALLPGALGAAYAAYASIWAPLGAALAAVATLALARRWRWGRPLAVVHAALSLPSIVLTPLAIYLLAPPPSEHRS